jgi:hypothetical protein
MDLCRQRDFRTGVDVDSCIKEKPFHEPGNVKKRMTADRIPTAYVFLNSSLRTLRKGTERHAKGTNNKP